MSPRVGLQRLPENSIHNLDGVFVNRRHILMISEAVFCAHDVVVVDQRRVRISLLSSRYLFVFIDQQSFGVLNWLFIVFN